MAGPKRPAAVTIVMRARNEVRWVERTLQAVFRQRERDFEIVFVDSGSRDGTLEVARRAGVRLIEIPPQEFSYSRALNAGAAQGQGEFIVCLNADAEPVDDLWLSELLRPLREDERVAASYARQRPRPGAHPTVQRDYGWAFGDAPPAVDPPFFSMVSSAFRRALWERHRFWSHAGAGDDIEWVRWARAEGFRIAYAPRSVVLHSHNYSAVEHFRKQRREHRIQLELYGFRHGRGPLASLARFGVDALRDARFVNRTRTWGALPSAVAFRWMQACGRIHGWLQARGAQPGRAATPGVSA